MANTRLGYDPDAKIFTLEDDVWNEMINVTIIILYLHLTYNTYYTDILFLVFYALSGEPEAAGVSLQTLPFEEELDNLFIGNSATGEVHEHLLVMSLCRASDHTR